MARSVAATGATSTTTTARRSVGGRSTATAARDTPRSARTATRATGAGKADRAPATGGRASGRGFNAFKGAVKESSKKDFGTFTVDYDKTSVIAFMESENFDFIHRHWVDVAGDDGRVRSTPRNCIQDHPEEGQRCPLCDIGDEPKPVALFNVIDLDEPGKVQLWEVTTGIFEEIDALATELAQVPEDRGGPLELNSPGVYVAVSKRKAETKSGKGGVTKYTVKRVKERDLDEDHSLDPLTDEQFEEAMEHLKTMDDILFSSYDDLKKLADSLED